MSELRLLASADQVSRSILTIILAGDQRLAGRLEEPDWLPIASRIRSRLRLEALPPKALQDCLAHLLKSAGAPKLRSASLTQTLPTETKPLFERQTLEPFQECSGSFSLGGIEVQAAQVEKDVRLETLFIPIAISLFDQSLDFVVQAFDWTLG